MNRYEIIKFYENRVDDIVDKDKREELQKKISEIEDILISLEEEIDEELQQQESDYIEDEIGYDYNYYVNTVRGDLYA